MSQNETLRKTPLYAVHRELGAKMVPFAGWSMPIQYKGLIQEHLCVRNAVGLFDVSHMGEIEVKGPSAKAFLQYVITNDINKLKDTAILYSLMCYEHGGVVDDLLVHRYSEDHYFLCVNASNIEKDFQWIESHAEPWQVEVRNISLETAQLAIQGPSAEPLLQQLTDLPLKDIQYYHFNQGKIHNIDGLISRTGYTGEDGFEVYLPADKAETVYRQIMEAGKEFDIQPIGLGARDTLRLEMGYPLYGNDIDRDCQPLERGLGWVIKLAKEDFLGKSALVKAKEAGLKYKLCGIKLLDRGVPRSHYAIYKEGNKVGEVTSGTFSPSLNQGIGMCYVAREFSATGTPLEVEIRNQRVPAEVVKLPFVPSHVKK